MFLNRRPPRGPGRFLQWKMRLLAVGAVLLLIGMARAMDLLVILSIVVLAGAVILRFFEKDDEEDPVAIVGDGGEEALDRVPHRRATDVDNGDASRPT